MIDRLRREGFKFIYGIVTLILLGVQTCILMTQSELLETQSRMLNNQNHIFEKDVAISTYEQTTRFQELFTKKAIIANRGSANECILPSQINITQASQIGKVQPELVINSLYPLLSSTNPATVVEVLLSLRNIIKDKPTSKQQIPVSPKISINVSNTCLQNQDLSSFSETNLLIHSNFSKTRLENANLSGLVLDYANFERSALHHANLNGSKLRNANFKSSNLYDAKLISSDLRGAVFFNTKLRKTDLSSANLSSQDFEDSNFQGLELRKIIGNNKKVIQELSLDSEKSDRFSITDNITIEKIRNSFQGDHIGTYILDSEFNSAKLNGANLSRTLIWKTRFIGSDLSKTDLTHIKLLKSWILFGEFEEADFSEAEFSHSQLHDFCLKDVNVNGAHFSNTEFIDIGAQGTNLSLAVFSNSPSEIATNCIHIKIDSAKHIRFNSKQEKFAGYLDLDMSSIPPFGSRTE
jgi:uncharacterized protein YjbI with pentapeptide repeats